MNVLLTQSLRGACRNRLHVLICCLLPGSGVFGAASDKLGRKLPPVHSHGSGGWAAAFVSLVAPNYWGAMLQPGRPLGLGQPVKGAVHLSAVC